MPAKAHPLSLLAVLLLFGCASTDESDVEAWSSIVQSGDAQPHTRAGQLAEMGPIKWATRAVSAPAVVVEVDLTTRRQTIHGFGGARLERCYGWLPIRKLYDKAASAAVRVFEDVLKHRGFRCAL